MSVSLTSICKVLWSIKYYKIYLPESTFDAILNKVCLVDIVYQSLANIIFKIWKIELVNLKFKSFNSIN